MQYLEMITYAHLHVCSINGHLIWRFLWFWFCWSEVLLEPFGWPIGMIRSIPSVIRPKNSGGPWWRSSLGSMQSSDTYDQLQLSEAVHKIGTCVYRTSLANAVKQIREMLKRRKQMTTRESIVTLQFSLLNISESRTGCWVRIQCRKKRPMRVLQ